MDKTKAVGVKKKPAAAQVMTRVQVKKLLDERDDKCLSAVQDLKRELMGAMAQNHDQTHSKLKRIHEGAIDTYNAMNEGMMDLSDSICNVEEELKRQGGPINPPKSPTEVVEEERPSPTEVVEEESPYKGFSYKDAKITFYG
jgi:hypothetical protein